MGLDIPPPVPCTDMTLQNSQQLQLPALSLRRRGPVNNQLGTGKGLMWTLLFLLKYYFLQHVSK